MSVALQDEDHHEHHPGAPHLDAAQLALLQHHHDEHEAFHEHFPHEQEHPVHDELHHEQQQLQAQDLPHEQQPYHEHQQPPQQHFHSQQPLQEQQEQQHLQQQEPSQPQQQQQQGVVQPVVLTQEQLAQLSGALGSGGGDLAALSGSLGSNELLQRLMSPAVQAGPEAAEHEQHGTQAHIELPHAAQPGGSPFMDVLPSSSGMDADTSAAQQHGQAAAEAGMLQQDEPAGAAVAGTAGVAEAHGQQQAALADPVDAVMMPLDVQQGVKRKAGECAVLPAQGQAWRGVMLGLLRCVHKCKHTSLGIACTRGTVSVY
jgi:hypothetical protein